MIETNNDTIRTLCVLFLIQLVHVIHLLLALLLEFLLALLTLLDPFHSIITIPVGITKGRTKKSSVELALILLPGCTQRKEAHAWSEMSPIDLADEEHEGMEKRWVHNVLERGSITEM